MTTETLTCPYCNAAITVQPGMATGERMTCPRCGDTFALRHLDSFFGQLRPPLEETGVTTAPAVVSPMPSIAEPSLQSRRPNWIVAGAVIGVMLVMAGGGLAFMLWTQDQRRAQDTNRPPRRPGKQPGAIDSGAAPVPSVSPDKLAALGYLPPDTNLILAARITELLGNATGLKLLRDPIHIGTGEYRLANMPSWVGFRLEEVDHFVFAAKVDDALLPPFYVVLRTTQPYDAEQMRQRLKATRVASAGKKTVYSFRTMQKDLPLVAWFADERTLVLALLPDHLESLPARPVEGLEQLSDDLRGVLKERRELVAPVWIVGHSRNWTKTSVVRFMTRLSKEDLQRLTQIQTFGIWLVPHKSLSVKAVVGCKDDVAARGLDDYFHSPRGDANPTFKTALDGPWLTMQFQTTPDFISRAMKR